MDYIRYANTGATRNMPLSEDLVSALGFLPELGVQAEVFSGGQPLIGSGQPRVGSTRHDSGGAADVFFYKDGRRLDWANPEDQPVFSEIVRRGRQSGLTGFGAGPNYMQPGSMHIGFGAPSVWGAGGKSANAPEWLREAYYGANAPQGGNMQPQGLLATPTVSTQGQEPEKLPFFQRPETANLLDTLAIGFSGMTLNPNQALIQSAQERIKGRRESAQTAQQRNATAAWLESQGLAQLADGVRSGAITGAEAMTLARGGGQEATAAQRNYEFLISQNIPQDQAIERAFGGGVNVNFPGAPTIGTIPPGYQAVQDPQTKTYRFEPIAGGPVAAQAETRAGQQEAAAATAQDSLRLIDSVLNSPNLESVTGMFQGRVPALTQAGTDLVTRIEQLQGQAFLQAFESLKGGGAITEREGIAAQNAIANLNRAQSGPAFKESLKALRDIVDRGRRRAAGENVPEETSIGGVVVGDPY